MFPEDGAIQSVVEEIVTQEAAIRDLPPEVERDPTLDLPTMIMGQTDSKDGVEEPKEKEEHIHLGDSKQETEVKEVQDDSKRSDQPEEAPKEAAKTDVVETENLPEAQARFIDLDLVRTHLLWSDHPKCFKTLCQSRLRSNVREGEGARAVARVRVGDAGKQRMKKLRRKVPKKRLRVLQSQRRKRRA